MLEQTLHARGAKRTGRQNRSVRVGRSRTGKGVFARRHYLPDDMIGEIFGELIRDENYGSDYCFQIGDGMLLEPIAPFRFINHSCDPNCEFDWFDVAGDGENARRRRVFLFAVSQIEPGDELTIDYNWSASAAIPCNCRSASCRGWIVDPGQLEQLARSASSRPT